LEGSEEPASHEGASFLDAGARINHSGFDDNGDINMGGSSTSGSIDMGVNDGMSFEHQGIRHIHYAPPLYVDAPPVPWKAAPPGHAWMLTRPQWALAPIRLPSEVPIGPMQYDSHRAYSPSS